MDGFLAVIIAYLIQGLIFGFITQHVAESKGYSTGFAWGFWLGIIGLLVVGFKPNAPSKAKPANNPTYSNASSGGRIVHQASTRPSQNKGWVCNCGATNPSSHDFCMSCYKSRGDNKPINKINCPHCGASNNSTNKLCFACNKALAVEPLEIQSESTPTVVDTVSDNSELLETLAKLHDKGILTDEEFQQKKASILARM